MMVHARVELDDQANKVLNVIKAKYDLKDKSAAINKMADMFGNEFIDVEATPQYMEELDRLYEDHIKKYGQGKMSLEELDALCEV